MYLYSGFNSGRECFKHLYEAKEKCVYYYMLKKNLGPVGRIYYFSEFGVCVILFVLFLPLLTV
jgi:hypothetical protein